MSMNKEQDQNEIVGRVKISIVMVSLISTGVFCAKFNKKRQKNDDVPSLAVTFDCVFYNYCFETKKNNAQLKNREPIVRVTLH